MNDHVCPRPLKGLLPMKIIQHAAAGRVKEVCQWLSEGGNINAADSIEQTLMHYACLEEQAALVKKLLEYPDLHLNTRITTKEGLTPLGIAANSGFLEIVQILLETEHSKCKVDPAICFGSGGIRNNRITAIVIATHGGHWSVVKLLIKHYDNMREPEGYSVLSKAIEHYEYDIAKSIIQQKNPYQDHDFGSLIQEIYRSKQWELLEAIIRKNVFYKNDSSKKLFYPLVVAKDWSNLERYLRLTDNGVKLHVSLVEAILERKKEEVQRLLEEVKDARDVITGTLYVAIIAGSTEDMANLLVNEVPIEYSEQTLNNALIIASMGNRLEFLPHLLKKKVFSYQILSRSRLLALSQNKFDANNLLQKAMEERIKEFSQTQKVTKEDESKTDNDEKDQS